MVGLNGDFVDMHLWRQTSEKLAEVSLLNVSISHFQPPQQFSYGGRIRPGL